MLPLCFGQATKFARFLLEADKCYHVVAKLGEATATGDSEGEVITYANVPALTEQDLELVLDEFRGEIAQIPSMY